jgi:UDP-2-acetamido-2,6-beta-L-arabino-hexul-4-ose reductase
MRVLITGSNGFIGRNMAVRLGELEGYEVLGFDKENSFDDLRQAVEAADAVVHLAGRQPTRWT